MKWYNNFDAAWGLIGGICVLAAAHSSGIAGDDERNNTTANKKLLEIFTSELVKITPGQGRFPKSFQMGSTTGAPNERPVRTVEMTHNFAIARYEVPQNLYEAVMGTNPSKWKGPRNSAEGMTWDEANEFCRKITALLHREGLMPQTQEIRLPTEAEWEYCCRAGLPTEYCFGNEPRQPGDEGKKASLLDAYAWHTGNAAGNDPEVGVLLPNLWDLYDMHGYLWEYCADDWQPDYKNAPSDERPRLQKESRRKAMRGGAWTEQYPLLRCAARKPVDVDQRSDAVGFRCVRAATKVKP